MPAMHAEGARGRSSTEVAAAGRRRRRRRVAVLLAAALTAAVGASSAQADAVDEWNDVAATITMSPAPAGTGAPVPVAIFDLATVSAAMYDAANAIDRGYAPFRASPKVHGRASLDAAVAAAARDTLVGLFPAFTTTVDLRYAASLAAIPDGRAKTEGIAVGQSVAAVLLADRAGDGRGVDRPEYYVPLPAGAGVWVPVSGRGVFPWLGHVRPFTLDRVDQFVPGPPPALTSDEYASAYNEVKDYGRAGSAVRTPEQTNLALFMTEPPPRQWNRLARGLTARFGVDAADRARLYAMMNVASADAVISCWNAKYGYQTWRPLTAITTSFDDGNAATATDATWTPLRPTPNYADYPSGHACVTGASMAVLRHFFGTDRVSFTANSVSAETPATGLIDDTLEFERFSDVARAVQDARVYLGIHFRFAQVAGDQVGRRTARWVTNHAFQPRDCRGGRCRGGCDDRD